MCTLVTLAVPYLLLSLQDVQWAMRNGRGARKLARTPHVNKKKKVVTAITHNTSVSSILSTFIPFHRLFNFLFL
jgi:hypothetical protein